MREKALTLICASVSAFGDVLKFIESVMPEEFPAFSSV